MRALGLSILLLATVILLSACNVADGGGPAAPGGSPPPTGGLTVGSPAVAEGGRLPAQYCAFGGGQSLPLTIAGAPAATAGLLLICDDPDAVSAFGTTYAHWLLADLPPGTTALAANADAGGLPVGTRRGRTSGGGTGWEGPWPPSGENHRYRLRVYALSSMPMSIDLGRTWTRAQFEAAYSDRILASGALSFVVLGPAG